MLGKKRTRVGGNTYRRCAELFRWAAEGSSDKMGRRVSRSEGEPEGGEKRVPPGFRYQIVKSLSGKGRWQVLLGEELRALILYSSEGSSERGKEGGKIKTRKKRCEF